ncbi:hypothetical protein AMQ84_03465 [Paenibacillus riograndensis]|uniref:Uncharacterized protein n=1 Tax=Paenibacillus riograndensis TaxID=483937 RepID=A0A132UAF0_9BACL|nr:hypothetical protein AMQ84_03465 [Paenibacillus riograndensis]KWX87931.1 hypothetical protein AMQ83_10015 [Paenibacillus riograndensis]
MDGILIPVWKRTLSQWHACAVPAEVNSLEHAEIVTAVSIAAAIVPHLVMVPAMIEMRRLPFTEANVI